MRLTKAQGFSAKTYVDGFNNLYKNRQNYKDTESYLLEINELRQALEHQEYDVIKL